MASKHGDYFPRVGEGAPSSKASLGVITFEEGETNRIYYKADKEKVKDLFNKVLKDIIE